ncbi:hypothetical protein AMJ52_01230 [candidate division TA06 bacterium DG_78]|uniref:Uncharacterized protein n=1 Tax=candidate division TA06 bacterium DG_78 TaxID=1703772 RepID=A0A0S7YIA5_UNCT6|nr:MAG: hypothetical protein AMJ52_01230 [candidate division TA06 bacterium DG_78]
MNITKKGVMLSLLCVIMLGIIGLARADYPIVEQYGKLIDVKKTSNVIDNQGRYEYEVTMEIDGAPVYLTLMMPGNEAQELKQAQGMFVKIYYQGGILSRFHF